MTELTYSDLPSILNRIKFNLGRGEYNSVKKEISKIIQIVSETDVWFINKTFRKQINATIRLKAVDEIWEKKDINEFKKLIKEFDKKIKKKKEK